MSMKYIYRVSFRHIGCCFCILCLSFVARAYGQSDSRHYFTTSLSGAYVMPVGNYEHLNSFNALSGNLALGYEMEYRNLLIQTGVGVQLNHYQILAEKYTTSLTTWDSQGTEMRYTYFFTDRKDKAMTTSVSVPLLVGGRWSYFYFLAGVMNTIRVQQSGSAYVSLSCSGKYNRYIAELEKMDNHAFYSDETLTNNYSDPCVQALYQLSPYLELGADFCTGGNTQNVYRRNTNQEIRVRVAGYVQCGLLNEQKKCDYQLPYIVDSTSPYDMQKIQIPALMDNDYIVGDQLRQLAFGIKVTVLFHMVGTAKHCVSCGY